MHIGQTEIATGVPIRQLFVIQAQQVQDGCVPVVDVAFSFDGSRTYLVG